MFIERRFYNGPMAPSGEADGIFDYGHGISAVDSVYDRRMQTAIHLLVEDGRAAIIDTGTSHAVPQVIAARMLGIAASTLSDILHRAIERERMRGDHGAAAQERERFLGELRPVKRHAGCCNLFHRGRELP